MKTVYRVLVILVVAALLGGMMYAAVSASGTSGASERREFDEERFARPEGNFRPEREEGGVRLPFGVVKSLVLMALVGVPYFFWSRRKRSGSALQAKN